VKLASKINQHFAVSR